MVYKLVMFGNMVYNYDKGLYVWMGWECLFNNIGVCKKVCEISD